MWVIPNTTVTVLRSSATDSYSGTVTNETTVASGLSASITEQSRAVDEPITGEPKVIRFVTGRVPDGTGIQQNDKIYDEINNRYFWVISVRQHSNPLYTSEEILDLKRISASNP